MCESIAHDELTWREPEVSRRYAALMLASLTRESGFAQLPALLGINVEALLPQISCPTLILHRSESKVLPEGEVQRIAAAIPGSKLALFDGACTAPFLGDWRRVMRTMAEFLGLNLLPARTDRRTRALRLLSMRSDALTPRERQVVHLVVRGLTNRQIAEELFLAEKTVGNHIGRILVKLDLNSRTQLAAYAVEHGITSLSA
jgi:DNA-binding CsgD family transcriptional regulator